MSSVVGFLPDLKGRGIRLAISMKTADGSHGLGIAFTNLTYDASKASQQQVWGIETDLGENKKIWDIDQIEAYPNRPNTIPIENPEDDSNELQWMRLGMREGKVIDLYHETGGANISLDVTGVGEFVDFKEEPSRYKGQKFVDSMVLASYIEEEAHADGELPGLEGASVEVSPEGLRYAI